MHHLQCSPYDNSPNYNGHNDTIGDYHLHDHTCGNYNPFANNDRT